jgi:hypothetical protein
MRLLGIRIFQECHPESLQDIDDFFSAMKRAPRNGPNPLMPLTPPRAAQAFMRSSGMLPGMIPHRTGMGVRENDGVCRGMDQVVRGSITAMRRTHHRAHTKGFVWVQADHAEGKTLQAWIDLAARYVRQLPPK